MSQNDRLDGFNGNTAIKSPCDTVADSNITLSGEQTLNGVTTSSSRVLVIGQTDQTQNGIYVSSTGSWSRSKDFDGAKDVVNGTLVTVQNSTSTYDNTVWKIVAVGDITIGSTSITFQQAVFSDAATVNFTQSGTGSISRTVQEKLRERVTSEDYGSAANGTTDDYTAIINCLNTKNTVTFLKGKSYLINTGIVLTNHQSMIFEENAKLLCGTNSMTAISCVTGFGTQLINPWVDGNGKTGCTAYSLDSFRVGARIVNPRWSNIATGLYLTGCFGLLVETPIQFGSCTSSIISADNNAGMTIFNPQLNNEVGAGGTGTGIGIDIQYGTTGVGPIVQGGYVQGYDKGIQDAASGTQISYTYFEACTTADIYSNGARGFTYKGTQHWGIVGAVACYGRSCEGGYIDGPTLGSGGRTDGLFDYDATNIGCRYLDTGNTIGLNTIGAKAIGIYPVSKESSGTFTGGLKGSITAGTVNITTNVCTWKVIGTEVIVRYHLIWDTGTGTGTFILTGVPTNLVSTFPIDDVRGSLILKAAFTGPVTYCAFSGTSSEISLRQVDATGSATNIPITAAGELWVVITFTTNKTVVPA